jgi:hypothetical protein
MHPGEVQNPAHFLLVQGLRKNIEATKVEDFRPQVLVSQEGGYDERRGVGQRRRHFQDIFPIAIRQVLLADHHASMAARQMESRLPDVPYTMRRPRKLFEDGLPAAIVFNRTDEPQRGSRADTGVGR